MRPISLILLSILVCSTAYASDFEDDIGLNDSFDDVELISMHSSRLEQSIYDTPEAVTVFTARDIKLLGVRDLGDIFQYVPGYRTVKTGPSSFASYHGGNVRTKDRQQIMINGQDVIFPESNLAFFSTLPVPIESIEKITVFRGSNGAAFGDNAFISSINIETKKDLDGETVISGKGGNNGYGGLYLFNGGKVGNGHYSVSLAGEESDNYDWTGREGNETFNDTNTKKIHGTIDQEINSDLLVKASFGYTDHERQLNPLSFIDDKPVDLSSEIFIGNLYSSYLINEDTSLDASIGYIRGKLGVEYLVHGSPVGVLPPLVELSEINAPLARDVMYEFYNLADFLQRTDLTAQESALLGDLVPYALGPYDLAGVYGGTTNDDRDSEKFSYDLTLKRALDNVRYTIGASFSHSEIYSETYFDGLEQSDSYKVFSQLEYINGDFTYNLGAMFQNHDYADNAVNSRAAVNYRLSPKSVIRAAVSRSERAPSLMTAERYWRYHLTDFEPGSGLDLTEGYWAVLNKPEEHIENEKIISYSLGYYFSGEKYDIDLKVFYDEFKDPIVDPLEYHYGVVHNGENYEVSGAEGSINTYITPKTRLMGSLSYIDNNSSEYLGLTDLHYRYLERSLHSTWAGSIALIQEVTEKQYLTLHYVGNSEMAGYTFDQFGVVYNVEDLATVAGMDLKLSATHVEGNSRGNLIDGVGGAWNIDIGGEEGYDESWQYWAELKYAF